MESYPQKVMDNEWDIRPESSDNYVVSLSDPLFSPSSYSFRVLDESGYLIASYQFDEVKSLLVTLPDNVREKNRYLYFVTDEPFKQRIYKVEI